MYMLKNMNKINNKSFVTYFIIKRCE